MYREMCGVCRQWQTTTMKGGLLLEEDKMRLAQAAKMGVKQVDAVLMYEKKDST
jgi:hypothetical protein